MPKKKHWKAALKEQCEGIFKEMRRRYKFIFREVVNTAHTTPRLEKDEDSNEYTIICRKPNGYVSLALFLHEVGHLRGDHFTPEQRSDLRCEVEAWRFARDSFREFGIEWKTQASACAQSCLLAHTKHRDFPVEVGSHAALLEALEKIYKEDL